MRQATVWQRIFGVHQCVIEGTRFDEEGDCLVVEVRPYKRLQQRPRCSQCGRQCPGYDQGGGRRRWRSMDLGVMRVEIEAEAPRVECPEHGVVVAQVPWARAGSGFTRQMEDAVAWLATKMSKSAVGELARVAWRTVGRILERVYRDKDPADALIGVKRIGIDETSYRKGHRYLTVVVDHDTGHLIWAAEGRDKETLSVADTAVVEYEVRTTYHFEAGVVEAYEAGLEAYGATQDEEATAIEDARADYQTAFQREDQRYVEGRGRYDRDPPSTGDLARQDLNRQLERWRSRERELQRLRGVPVSVEWLVEDAESRTESRSFLTYRVTLGLQLVDARDQRTMAIGQVRAEAETLDGAIEALIPAILEVLEPVVPQAPAEPVADI